jgi:2-polyprenyl-3-methyl-5-hydroxy-6-metoxy-1,4-benzoquinol methylase
MEYHHLYGPSVPEKFWVPSPSYILRRHRIIRLMKGFKPGKLLEVGCGAGTLLYEMSQRSFVCEALESSQNALTIARHVNESNVKFYDTPMQWKERFDYLFAFEVLGHIEDDCAALATWGSYLKPGGVMLISVPAHMRKWTASDVWAGHFRRYERSALLELVSKNFIVEHCENYGFPLANMIAPIRSQIHARSLKKRNKYKHIGQAFNTEQSGVARNTESKYYWLLKSLPGRILMHIFFLLQNLSAQKDWGNGYLVLARKI